MFQLFTMMEEAAVVDIQNAITSTIVLQRALAASGLRPAIADHDLL